MKSFLVSVKDKKNHFINIFLLLLVSVIVFKPFISSKYVWGHDSFYHYANILATSKTISFSKLIFLPTKIIPIIAYNFGWAEGIFYPSIPEYSVVYLYKIVKIFGITNIFTSMKIIHFMMYFLSGITMYILGLKIYNNDKSALLCSIFYITFPYYYIDIFVRDALNECFLFVFIPLVFLGIEYLFEENYKKFYIYFVVGYYFCINCHLVLSIYLTIFVIIYLFFNINKVLNINNIKYLFTASLIVLGLSSFYLLPLILHTVNSNYVVYLKDVMCRYDTIINSTVKFKDYFNFSKPKSWTGIVLSTISIPCLITFMSTLFCMKKSSLRKKIMSFNVIIIIIIIIMSPLFPWKYIPKFFWNIQFVWRLNTFLLFFMSLASGLIINSIKNKKMKTYILLFLLLFSVIFITTFKKMLILKNFDVKSFDISKSGAASFQYIPVKAYRNLDYVKKRNQNIVIVKGDAKISNVISDTPYLSFYVKTNGAVLELPRFFYKIYNIKSNGKKINYKENSRGFIEIRLKSNSKVVVDENDVLVNYIPLFFEIISLFFFGFILKYDID